MRLEAARRRRSWIRAVGVLVATGIATSAVLAAEDLLREIQTQAVQRGRSPIARYGPKPGRWDSWHHHTNRLVPVYTFGTAGAGPGVDLESYGGERSVYRSREGLERLYGSVPDRTWNPTADYMDQTDLAALQRAALAAGRRQVIVVVFDGMDWETVRAAAIYSSGRSFDEGRGAGLHFLDYAAGGTTQFGFAVASPSDDHHDGGADSQHVRESGTGLAGGYDAAQGGPNPWTPGSSPGYPMAQRDRVLPRHAIADSAAGATAICAGVKTYNGAINVDPQGRKLPTVAHEAQAAGKAIGIVTSVPLSHATPAAAYAHNVSRQDYQDLSRDLLGLRSVSHPDEPLLGVDVLIGCGFGVESRADAAQGRNFVPGNRYLAGPDLLAVDAIRGGRYLVAQRESGVPGGARLAEAAERAATEGKRLLGFYGVTDGGGHLPFATADGRYDPVRGRGAAERYSAADLKENPTLAEMAAAALEVLSRDPEGFWLMVEAGDVDWANHDANLDAAIGAVRSGDEAIRVVTDWIERHSGWDRALLIVTSDHGHYLVLTRPEALAGPSS